MRELAHTIKNYGIIVKVARLHWLKWPPHVKAVYELPDVINDITVALVSKLHMYDPSKAQVSTWVWTLADNHCKTILTSYMSQKRQHYPVELKITGTCMRKHSSAADEIVWHEARRGFEALLSHASDELREALDTFIDARPAQFNPFRDFGGPLLEELQTLVVRHGVSRDALALVLDRV